MTILREHFPFYVSQVKLLDGGTEAGGIAAFLGKAVEPPAPAIVRHAVSSLQLIGALTCAACPLPFS